MIAYQGRLDEDWLVAQWWRRMFNDDDLGDAFTSDSRTLAALFRMIAAPRFLLYRQDDEGIYAALWGEQLMNGACIGFWLRKDYRQSKAGLHAVLDFHEAVLRNVPHVFALTKHGSLLSTLTRLGYVLGEELPDFMDGQTARFAHLTRERFHQTLVKYSRVSVTLAELVGA